VAKNLFLWPSRSYVRKALEIPLALWIDLVWTKRRIVEVYVNTAEWAPGVYGAEAAAQHHFNKSAKALTRSQAASLAAVTAQPGGAQCRPARPANARKGSYHPAPGQFHSALSGLPEARLRAVQYGVAGRHHDACTSCWGERAGLTDASPVNAAFAACEHGKHKVLAML
jgi:hypothetical protein